MLTLITDIDDAFAGDSKSLKELKKYLQNIKK